jgi:hypothetical protein
MTSWVADLARMAPTDDLHIAPFRSDGTEPCTFATQWCMTSSMTKVGSEWLVGGRWRSSLLGRWRV